jgi:hypothetical protein
LLACYPMPRCERKCWGARKIFSCGISDLLNNEAQQHLWGVVPVPESQDAIRKYSHVLRHTAAMDLLQARGERALIALWLGHESVETNQGYYARRMVMESGFGKCLSARSFLVDHSTSDFMMHLLVPRRLPLLERRSVMQQFVSWFCGTCH